MKISRNRMIAVAVLLAAGCSQQDQAPAQVVQEPAAGVPAEAVEPPVEPGVRPERFDGALLADAEPVEMCAVALGTRRLSATPSRPADVRRVELRGWIGNAATMSWPGPSSLVLEQVHGKRLWGIDVGAPVAREDVAKHFGTQDMLVSGYRLDLDLSGLPKGMYRVYVTYGRDGIRYVCNRGSILDL